MKENRKDWCKLPYKVILDENLSNWAAKVLYAVLLDVSNNCVVKKTIKKLSEMTGMSPRYIKDVLTHLQKAGYILSRKTDGRKLILEIQPMDTASTSSSEATDHEDALIKLLAKKIRVKDERYVFDVYSDLKAEAMTRVKDPTKVFSYLSKMISNYEDKSDGFNVHNYEDCINNFD